MKPSLSIVGRSNGHPRECPPEETGPLPLDAASFELRLRRAIAEAIQRAPQPEQLVLSLLYEHRMSVQEVGSVLGLSDQQVYVLHAHSIARLCGRVMEP